MTYTAAAFLGLIQGITEFLPVSSDGHLTLAQQFINLPAPPLSFNILLHAGTLLATVFFFRNQLVSFYRRHFIAVVIGTIPAVIVGMLAYLYLQEQMDSGVVAAVGLLFTSAVLFSSHFFARITKNQTLTPARSLIIGLMQSAAIAPGISRSGTTIATGKMLGLSTHSAFEISFLLGIPAIFGAFIVSLKDLSRLNPADMPASVLGFVVALTVGLFSLKLLEIISRRHSLLPFAWYTLFLGSLSLGLFL